MMATFQRKNKVNRRPIWRSAIAVALLAVIFNYDIAASKQTVSYWQKPAARDDSRINEARETAQMTPEVDRLPVVAIRLTENWRLISSWNRKNDHLTWYRNFWTIAQPCGKVVMDWEWMLSHYADLTRGSLFAAEEKDPLERGREAVSTPIYFDANNRIYR
jgi:hypothetical protein